MTYLSRIRINPLRAESRKLLANPRAMRGAILGGIPDQPTQERLLWRLDADNPRRPMLYVLTESKPDWTHIIENAGWPEADGDHASIADYTPLLTRIALGRQFAFRLTANPIQNTTTPTKPTPIQTERTARGERRGHRIGHRTAAHQLAWFLDRTQRWGFQIPPARTDPPAPGLPEPTTPPEPARDVRITARDRRSFNKNGRGKPVVIHTATFEGRLQITDPDLFTERLLRGIGPAKAYGCGLLTLAPLPGNG
ncbi:type I-E CRISPR-associated protein Cas6/Cse3/CasE [Actinoallomurus sp. NPDC052308]|uniref:type I-E CRISPR-associated protein Cas6/Cse3/CasE n=1 Tax=Actinoallomurus sp. NPDC052308 TaxID=3155530 RepID=UPI0034469EE2